LAFFHAIESKFRKNLAIFKINYKKKGRLTWKLIIELSLGDNCGQVTWLVISKRICKKLQSREQFSDSLPADILAVHVSVGERVAYLKQSVRTIEGFGSLNR